MTERYEITFTEGGVGALETIITGGIANIAEKTLDTVSGDDNHGWYCHIKDTDTGVKVSCWGATKAEAQEIAQYEIKIKIEDFVEEKEREERERERERRTQNTRQDSSSDDGSSFIGKIIGFLIVAVIVIWLVFTVIIPLVFINIALISLVVGLTKKNWSKFIYPLSFLGLIYVILDYNYGGFTKALAENVPFLSGVIPVLFYINVIAGLLATYFFIRNLLNDKNPQIKNEGEFSKRNLIIMSSLLFVGALTIGLQVYFSSKNINKIHYPNSNNTSVIDNDQIAPPPPPPNLNNENTDEKDVFTVVEEMPIFPGGMNKYESYIANNIKYPQQAKKNNIKGKVFLSFIIDKNGKLHNVKVLRGIGSGCDEEALRVFNNMPNWIPGKQRGKNVKVKYILAVNFPLK
jgi:TonB family protein